MFKHITRPKLVIFLCISCCLLLILLSYSNTEGTGYPSWFPTEKYSTFVQPRRFKDTKCQMPDLDPFHPSVKKFYEKLKVPYQCERKPSFLIIKPNATVFLNEGILLKHYNLNSSQISCNYETILRDSSSSKDPDDKFKLDKPKPLHFEVPLGVDFAVVNCLNSRKSFYEEYLAMTPLKHDVEDVKDTMYKQAEVQNKLNVVMLGMDSISRLNFIRHFHKTRKYLREEMKTFEMRQYNKVADNTFPNLTPLLTGHFVEHYGKRNTFDDLDFIWKLYGQMGYRTMLAEDAPGMATYNYLKKGFKKPPTDYYLRPFAIAIERSSFRKKSKEHCFGDRMEMKVMYDYTKSYIETMADRPHISFTFIARLTHDILNYAAYADEPAHEILKHLHETGVTNTSLVIFFSDHGMRFGKIRETYIGSFEDRWPMMHLSFPEWFLKKYPDLEQNLRLNQERLTNVFDVHATLLDVLDLIVNGSISNVTNKFEKGQSLFQEISKERTCEEALILPHFCTCERQQQVPVKSKEVKKVADIIMDNLNEMLRKESSKCAKLSLKTIHDAYHSIPENATDPNTMEYLVKISVKPSDALFEGTVHVANSKYEVQGDISRLNLYGSQGNCSKNARLQKYCFCQ